MGDFVLGVFVGAIACFAFLVVPFTAPNRFWQGAAIERGYGIYCPKNGQFAWVGECDDMEDTTND